MTCTQQSHRSGGRGQRQAQPLPAGRGAVTFPALSPSLPCHLPCPVTSPLCHPSLPQIAGDISIPALGTCACQGSAREFSGAKEGTDSCPLQPQGGEKLGMAELGKPGFGSRRFPGWSGRIFHGKQECSRGIEQAGMGERRGNCSLWMEGTGMEEKGIYPIGLKEQEW